MIFLIQYDRFASRTVAIRGFEDSHVAYREKLMIEIDLLNEGLSHEVVILEAMDEAALRKTHGRYFSGVEDISVVEGYEDEHRQKDWIVRGAANGWIVEADGKRLIFPSKESAIGAAAKDAKAWKRSTGKMCSITVHELSGTWYHLNVD